MRSLMITKDKNTGGIDTILQNDLSNNSALFDGDLLMKVNNKSQLISELENYMQEVDYLHDSFVHQAVMVDFMSVVRSIKIYKVKFPLFKDLLIAMYENIKNICNVNQLHYS